MTIEPPRRARWAAWAAAAAIAGACAGAQAAVMSGVYAAGFIRNVFRICTTCDSEFELLFADEDGTVGSTGPAIVDGYEAKGSNPQGYGSVYARALVVGPTATPYLGARAEAKPGVGPWPGYSGDGAYLFAANASARAAQHYTFLGSVAETYRMTFKLNGSAAGYISADTANDRLITANGGLALYDADPGYGVELPYGWPMDIEQLSFSAASASSFDESRTVSITLEPGDSFYAVAWLGATVGVGAWGAADVSHTLTVEFTAGDVALLQPDLQPQPQAQPMPEPATATLALLGLAAMRWSRRPHRTA